MKKWRALKNKGYSTLELSSSCHPTRTQPLSSSGAPLSQSIAWYQLTGIGVAMGMLWALGPTPHILSPSLFPALPRLALWWPSAGSAPRKPSTGAFSATSSWHGLWLCRWPACSAPGWWRCWCTGSCLTSEEPPPVGKGETAKLLPRGEAFPWKNQSERIHLPYLTSYLLYITVCHIGDMVMWCHFLYIKEIYMHIVGNNT